MSPKDKFNEVRVNETEKLLGALYDIDRLISILKCIKDEISEVNQRLKRLEDKVDEDEQNSIADKWASIK